MLIATKNIEIEDELFFNYNHEGTCSDWMNELWLYNKIGMRAK